MDAESVTATALIELQTRGRARLRSFDVPPLALSSRRLSDLPKLIDRSTATVAYAKSLDVKTLDHSLSSQSLEDWLRQGPAGLRKVDWRISDCAIRAIDDSRKHQPLCVDFVFERDQAAGVGIIIVGTLGEGPSGTPRLLQVLITKGKGAEARSGLTSKLANLASLIRSMQ